MSLKSILDNSFPTLASYYRLIRDHWLASRRRRLFILPGLDMIGVPGMVDSRTASTELEAFRSYIAEADVLVDAGANCGLFTLVAARAGKGVVSIEPNLENLAALLQNVHDSRFPDVEVLPLALGSRPGVLPLFGGGEGASLRKNWGGMASTYSRLVPVNTLDNLIGCRFEGRRLLIKVDVEGHEYDVLRGAVGLLKRTPAPIWLIEHGLTENFAGAINPHFQALFELFWSHNYECFTLDKELRRVTDGDIKRWLQSQRRDFGYLNYVFHKKAG